MNIVYIYICVCVNTCKYNTYKARICLCVRVRLFDGMSFYVFHGISTHHLQHKLQSAITIPCKPMHFSLRFHIPGSAKCRWASCLLPSFPFSSSKHLIWPSNSCRCRRNSNSLCWASLAPAIWASNKRVWLAASSWAQRDKKWQILAGRCWELRLHGKSRLSTFYPNHPPTMNEFQIWMTWTTNLLFVRKNHPPPSSG